MGGFPHCDLCGRLIPVRDAVWCSPRCRELAEAGYAAPAHAEGALTPPRSRFDARVFARASEPFPLEPSMVDLGPILDSAGGRRMVRIEADSEDELEAALDKLREAVGEEQVEVFTVQRFASGGLASQAHHSRSDGG